MRRRSLLVALILLLLPFVSTAEAKPEWFANLQLEVTGIAPVAFTPEGLLADVSFGGTAGGPQMADGTVVGVDHAVFDASGSARLNVYLTITDKNGDRLSANISGRATPVNPGQYVLQGASGTIIDKPDPSTGTFHATTGKYAHLINRTFRDVGFITDFSFGPPAGSVHATWYLD